VRSNTAKTDVSSAERRGLNNLGISNRQIDTLPSDELAALQIQKIKEKCNSIKDDKLFYPQMAALGINLDQQTLQTIRQTSGSEIEGLERQFGTDKPKMNIPEDAAKKWVEFAQEVTRVTTTLTNKFEVRLSELGPSLSRLSEGLGKAAEMFIDKDLGPWIGKLADGLESLATETGDEKTKSTISGFFDDIKVASELMAGTVHNLAALGKWLGVSPAEASTSSASINALSSLSSAPATDLSGTLGGPGGQRGKFGHPGGKFSGGGGTSPAISGTQRTANAQESWAHWKTQGYSDDAAAALVAMEEGESNFNPTIRGDNGASIGAFQWDATRRAAILRATGIDVTSASHSEQLKAADWEMGHGDTGAQRFRKHLLSGESIEKMVGSGIHDFERSGNQQGDYNKRLPYARGAIKQFHHDDTVPPDTKTKTDKPKVSIRSTPGSNIFAQAFANQYGSA
jgi:Phage tail lysozyme